MKKRATLVTAALLILVAAAAVALEVNTVKQCGKAGGVLVAAMTSGEECILPKAK